MDKKISAVIITRNVENVLPDCLYHLQWADEIIVADSGSKDKTMEIAKKYGAKVFQKKWEGYVKQKNFAISKAKGKWILSIDADEIVTDDLKKEIIAVINSDNSKDGYFIKIKNFYYGKFLKYGALMKDYHLRLFKRGKGKFQDAEVHEAIKVNGETANLKNYILHYPSENIWSHIEKVNKYTEQEIINLQSKNYKPTGYSVLLKWIFVFIKNYFFKFGFLDGINGLIFNVISAYYVLIKEIKYAANYGFQNIKFFKTLFKKAK